MPRSKAAHPKPLPLEVKEKIRPIIDLPSAIVSQLIQAGMRTEAGNSVLQTLLALNPAVAKAIREADGNFAIHTGPGKLVVGEKNAPQPNPPG